jgi:hypothetical protein
VLVAVGLNDQALPTTPVSRAWQPRASLAWSSGRIGFLSPYPHARFLGLDRNHSIADMLLANHCGIAAARAGVQENMSNTTCLRVPRGQRGRGSVFFESGI